MKYVANTIAILLGLLFVMGGSVFLAGKAPIPEFPEGSPIALFNAAMIPTGYMHFVKVFEVLGGILIAIPRTRNLGLVLLGPVVVNILASHVFILRGEGLFSVPVLFVTIATAFLLWTRRGSFLALLRA